MTYLSHDKDYEDGILNAIFSFPEDHPKIFSRLSHYHFSTPLSCKAYRVLKTTYEQTKPNPVSNQVIIADLTTLLEKEGLDWSFWVKHLTSEAPLPADVDFYIGRLIKNYNRRRIVEISNAATKRIEQGESGDQVSQFTKTELDRLESDNVCEGPINFLDVAVDCLEQLEQPKDDLTGIKTGFSDLDFYILGMRPADLIVVAGRPGMGKTTIATNICVNAAKQNYTGLIFSLEMIQYRLGLRILASETGMNLYKLSKGIVEDWNQINQVGSGLQNLYIDFSTGLTYQQVVSRILEFSETTQLDFVMLDYLQKLRFPGRSRHDIEVGQATTEFKNVAKELGIPFILLSQLSRANEKDGTRVRKPRMSDLKDSSSIEQDADIITFIHREEVYKPDDEKHRNIADIAIVKNRDGETNRFKLTFRKAINRFEDYANETSKI
ncbi:MAG: replicative DNA helicase [Candidatus Hodarchaeales archaeon]